MAGSSVNRGIQFLAQKYCVEAKASYAELSKIIQVSRVALSKFVSRGGGNWTRSSLRLHKKNWFWN